MLRLVLLSSFVVCSCNSSRQSAECRRYLECTEAALPMSSGQYLSSYGEGGTCWSTDLASADQCTAACVQGLELLSVGAGTGVPECQ
jgi:hypothetical protein